MQTSNDERKRGFSRWLRTGRLPRVRNPDGIELKFNPWHDPKDGRFTFAGAGRRFGPGEAVPAERAGGGSSKIVPDDRARRRITTGQDADAWRAEALAKYGHNPKSRARIETRHRQYVAALAQPQESRPNRAAELATGVGEGMYGVAKETARGVHAALTTDPRTTVDSAVRGIARTIDTAIAAEDTPALVQVSRAANSVVTASARDVGRAIGSTAANAALIVAPGAAAAKVSALRHARMARPRRTYKPARVGEAKETLVSDKPWKLYKDSAPGARPGYAPTLPRTMPDGSTRQVKFDGVEGDYMIDRKWSIVGWSSTKAQLLRQSEALTQQGLTSTLEVPDAIQKVKAIRLLKKSGITNIKVRIVKP